MTAVVKVGGVLLENPARAALEVLRLVERPTAIVHGGGIQITRMLERMNVSSTFIDGLRVTDEQTLAAVAAAVMGEVHTSFLAALRQAGLDAIGVFGAVHASRKSGPWGLVAANVHADAVLLNAVIAAGRVPVIPTLAVGSSENSLLNANGDETASAVAIAMQPAELVFLTDVDGVRDAAGTTIEAGGDPARLLQASFVSGGMLPKLRAVKAAMDGGIRRVRVGRTVFGGGVE